jgi:ATP-dependent protease HslVU (ClpYQ) peptidase subunit
MTTLAYKEGVLASDSLTTNGDTKNGGTQKVFKLPCGRLIGICGSVENGLVLVQAMKDGAEKPPKLQDVEALLIAANGAVAYRYEGKLFRKLRTKYIAAGSGMDYALAALWMGADAVKAVRAGIYFDRNSGGRVQTVKL